MNQRGFTLFEMSIVLVVIGLIAAGILLGRDLIFAAKLRAQISQIEEINAAVHSFETKYACLPGDCKNAAKFQLGIDGGVGGSGDGNEYITSRCFSTFTGLYYWSLSGYENANFWYHLVQAQLIAGDYPGYTASDDHCDHLLRPGQATPPVKLDGHGRIEPWYPDYTGMTNVAGGLCIMYPPHIVAAGGGVIFNPNKGHAILLASRCDGYPNVIYRANEIYAIDSKIDDARPYNGTVRGYMYALIMWDSPLLQNGFYDGYRCIELDGGGEAYYALENADVEPEDPGYLLTLQCGAVIQTGF